MDQDLFPPPDFALPGFAALVELTMAAQRIDHDQAIAFLEQHWARTGLGGVHPARDDNEGQEGDDATPRRPDREASQQPDEDIPAERPPRQSNLRTQTP